MNNATWIFSCFDGGLLGRIEGESAGEPLSVDFPMDHAACPGPTPP